MSGWSTDSNQGKKGRKIKRSRKITGWLVDLWNWMATRLQTSTRISSEIDEISLPLFLSQCSLDKRGWKTKNIFFFLEMQASMNSFIQTFIWHLYSWLSVTKSAITSKFPSLTLHSHTIGKPPLVLTQVIQVNTITSNLVVISDKYSKWAPYVIFVVVC